MADLRAGDAAVQVGFGERLMCLRNGGILAFALTLVCTGALAGTNYRCTVKPLTAAAWIPSRFTVEFSDDFTSAEVTDASFGVSVAAKVARHSERSYAITWSLPGPAVSTGASRTDPRFRALLNTYNQKMSIQSVPAGDRPRLRRGSGSCRIQWAMPQLAQNEAG